MTYTVLFVLDDGSTCSTIGEGTPPYTIEDAMNHVGATGAKTSEVLEVFVFEGTILKRWEVDDGD